MSVFDSERIPPRFRCHCVWAGRRCPNEATQEDGLCDWCGKRRPEDMRDNPNAIWHPQTGEFMALGGAGEAHQRFDGVPPTACWMPDSGRVLAYDNGRF